MMDVKRKEILNVYPHGSQVYRTATEDSDYDYICVVEDECYETDRVVEGKNDYVIYTKTQWDKMAKENSLDFMECFFLPSHLKVKEEFVPSFEIKKELIRSTFSSVASNSFVKCKKKLTIEKDYDPYVGKKSLWHAIRILDFGIQILEKGRIENYSAVNHLYKEIMGEPDDWNMLKEKYKKVYNSYKSRFRKFDRTGK